MRTMLPGRPDSAPGRVAVAGMGRADVERARAEPDVAARRSRVWPSGTLRDDVEPPVAEAGPHAELLVDRPARRCRSGPTPA